MTFLNPAVLIGLLAAAIPVIIHLLNLRKLKKIEFSTLAFLKELQKNKIRKIKIKQWLLLVLRILIILLIVLAFARPALRGLSIAGTTSAAKTTAVLIVDDTYSMSVLSQNGSYFNQAKDFAKKIIEQLKEGDEGAIIFISEADQQQNLTSDFNLLIDKLKQKEISYSKPDLSKVIAIASELVNKSNNFNREIYLFTDFQKNIFPPAEIKSDLSELLNENVKLYLFPLADREVFNIAIDDLKINNQIFEKGKPIKFLISVSNYSEQNIQNGVLSLFINNTRTAQKSFEIKAGQSVLIDIDAASDATGFIDVFAEIEPDDIEYDNKRFSSLFIPDNISALIISDENQSSLFLKLALQTFGNGKITIEERKSNQIGGLQIFNYDLVFLCTYNVMNDIDKLNKYLKDGGSLAIIPPVKTELDKFNGILKKLNLPEASGVAGKLNEKSFLVQFDKIDFSHPVFLNLFRKDDKKSFESPVINHYIRYSTQGKGNNIIALTDGSSFLSEFRIGSGKLFIFNTAFDPGWSNLPVKTIFAPLIAKSVLYLSQKEKLNNNLIAGESFNIDIGKIKSAQLKIIRPDSTSDFLNVNLTNQKFIDYKNTYLTGFYKIFSGNELIDNIAVNHEKSESNPVYAEVKDFEKFLQQLNFKGKLIEIDVNQNPLESINQARFGSELWRMFLLIAILLAIIEMTIARNLKKEVEGISTTN